ncbi:MAG: hypothetical protein M3041_10110 [Acidobacteriota bacterium]|nr:hypothetical protein [Acidobacteriota bacterium]
MRTTAIAAITLTVVGGAALYAATPAPVVATSTLISDVNVQANDSPLVRAAKVAVANRARMTVHAAKVIDNAALRSMGGHIAVSTNEGAPIPSGSASQQYPSDPVASANGGVDRAQVSRKIDDLRREHAAMAEEADQPYGSLYNEDLVNKRMQEIPRQLNQLQNQLTPPPPPSSPTPPQ